LSEKLGNYPFLTHSFFPSNNKGKCWIYNITVLFKFRFLYRCRETDYYPEVSLLPLGIREGAGERVEEAD
jgi:hypothetical protein